MAFCGNISLVDEANRTAREIDQKQKLTGMQDS